MSDFAGALALAQAGCLFILLFLSVVFDLRQGRINNSLIVAGLSAGLFLSIARGGIEGLVISCSGAAIGFAAFFFLYRFGCIGAGDVKLMTALGSLTSGRFVLYAMFFTSVCGAVMAIAVIIWRGNWRASARSFFSSSRQQRLEEVRKGKSGRTMPYSLAICFGTIWAVYGYWNRTGLTPW